MVEFRNSMVTQIHYNNSPSNYSTLVTSDSNVRKNRFSIRLQQQLISLPLS